MTRTSLLSASLGSLLLVCFSFLPGCAQTPDLKAGSSFRDCADCPEMIVVPAGKVLIGSTAADRARFKIPKIFSDREVKQLEVNIAKPFAVAKYEVTRGMWTQYVREADVKPELGCAGFDKKTGQWPMIPALSWQDPGFKQGDNEPVVCLNWPDAKGYVAWLAKKTGKPYRLMSETEWEYAARAGATTTFPWSDSIDVICEKANIMDKATAAELEDKDGMEASPCVKPKVKTFTEPVGSYAPNAFGLYDMVGNAWELVEDCATDTYNEVPADGSAVRKADCKTRMPRGGGWNSAPWTARTATRGHGAEAYRAVALGLRVARDLP